MRITNIMCCIAALLGTAHRSAAQQPKHAVKTPHFARPDSVLREQVVGMPTTATQEVRVYTATFKPGDQTVFHTHRAPVTVYVLEGTFTLEMDGRAPVLVPAGKAFIEPPNVHMTGFNRSTKSRTRVVVFYVSNPGEPFLDPVGK